MSKTELRFQGVNPETNIFEEVKETVAIPDAEVLITSAYLRKKAVDELATTLKRVGERGKAIIGIRNGTTSAQALNELIRTGMQVYVVDTGATDIIFHPKLYAAHTNEIAVMICGSANFTPSGLWKNFECVAKTTFDLTKPEEVSEWDRIEEAIDGILALGGDNVFRVENDADVEELLKSGRVVDEGMRVPSQPLGHADVEDSKRVPRIRARSAKPRKVAGGRKTAQTSKEEMEELVPMVKAAEGRLGPQEVWKSKPLVRRDLSLPNSAGTNPTGSMLLKKGQYKVDQQTYFRREVFADQAWSQDSTKPYFEYAQVKFRFLVMGIDYGIHTLAVKFDTRTDTETYKQKQPMASISWGECKKFLSDENLLDRIMTIYRDESSGVADSEGNRKGSTYVIEIE